MSEQNLNKEEALKELKNFKESSLGLLNIQFEINDKSVENAANQEVLDAFVKKTKDQITRTKQLQEMMGNLLKRMNEAKEAKEEEIDTKEKEVSDEKK